MSSSLRTTFGELGRLFDGPHATPTRRSDGPYFLNIASLKSGRLDLSESDHVSDEDFARWTRRVTPQTGDLLFSYETRIGEASLMPDGVRACLGRRMALLRPDRNVVDPRFLLYFYLSPSFQRTIAKHTVQGATVPRIGLATMPQWPVEIPQIHEQRAIAEVLAALDDKIAANQRVLRDAEEIMVLLASTARAQATVAELAVHSTRTSSPELFDARVAHFSLPAFDDAALPAVGGREAIKSSKFVLGVPSVLVSKLNPRIPRIWDVGTLPEQMAVASTEFVVLEPVSVTTAALSAALRQQSVSAELASNVSGTSGSHQRVKPAEILSLKVPDPRSLAGDVASKIHGLGRVAYGRRVESAELADVRGELLPLLMSGQVRAREAEQVVEGVA